MSRIAEIDTEKRELIKKFTSGEATEEDRHTLHRLSSERARLLSGASARRRRRRRRRRQF